MTAPLDETRNVSRSYGPVVALDDVSFALHAGDVVGLVGDNGAGKSTLVKVLSGAHQPSSGSASPYRRSGSADTYLVFEQYADDKAFNAHVTAQHTVRFNSELASLVEGRGSVLSWLEPC